MCSCKKEQQEKQIEPNQIQLGTWVSRDYKLQLPIHNLNGEGSNYSLLEYSDNTGRYLQIRHKDERGILTVELYRIAKVYLDEMILVSENNIMYEMFRRK